MEAQLSPLAARLLGARGQALLRKSTSALQNLWAKNRNTALVLGAIGAGAAFYVSTKNKDQPPKPVRLRFWFISFPFIH